jgi:hypothetical protein
MSLKEDILRGVDQYISATREIIDNALDDLTGVEYSRSKEAFDEDYSRLWDLQTFRKQFADGVCDYNRNILAEIIEQLILLEEDA